MKLKYHLAFLDMADRFGQTSEATRLKVGAIICKGDSPIACGVNGTPSGWHSNVCEGEDGLTLPEVRHAEKAALDKLRKSTESSIGCTMYVSHAPCLACSIEIVDAGITSVWYQRPYKNTDGIEYLKQRGVKVSTYGSYN